MVDNQRVTFTIFRFDPDQDGEPHFDNFAVSTKGGMTVLEALFRILEEEDGSLAFRYSCRGAVCGSCAMFINGSYRLACQTQISALGSKVSISPLPHLPIVKDLVVDMTPFYEKYERIIPYLKTATPDPDKERLQNINQRKALDEVIDCILCGACYSACPITWTNKGYLGPAALVKAYRFVADSRDEAARERLSLVSGEDGIWRCHSIFNCVEACPKNINQTYSIQQLKRKTLSQKLKFWR